MPSMACTGNLQSRRLALRVVIFAMAITAACGGASEDAVLPACAGLETVANRTGLIGQGEAEELTVNRLKLSAPEVTETKVEGIVASCLTTMRSYEQVLLGKDASTNPDLWPPDMPVWVVEVKGISRPAGISAANADNPYRYVMDVSKAKTGDAIAGSRYQEPKLARDQGE